jgi:ribose-phosphate pyrophosphokinase
MIINLTEGFKPFGEGKLEFSHFMFPSGVEHSMKIDDYLGDWEEEDGINVAVLITLRIQSSEDIMKLLLVTDAIKRKGVKSIGVFFPYVPYARQDRVMVEGEAFSLKVFADIINSQGYDWVGFYDVHSDVTPALINNSYNYSNKGLWSNVIVDNHIKDYYLCSPDAGASKKINKLVESVRPLPIDIIQCNKTRDLSTGKITGLTVSHSDLGGKDVYIVDDICSKGGTFMMIAEKLKELNAGKIYLVVSHWEGSADLFVLGDSGIDMVYTTDSMKDFTRKPQSIGLGKDVFKQYKLEDIL